MRQKQYSKTDCWNFPILMKYIKPHIQEALKTANKIKPKKTKIEHIIKPLKIKNKEKFYKAARGEKKGYTS